MGVTYPKSKRSVVKLVRRVVPTRLVRIAQHLWWQHLAKQSKKPDSVHALLDCQIAYNQYGVYCVPLDSDIRPAAARVLSGVVWEPETIKLVCDNTINGDIIHAGTYFGDFLPAFSHACSGGAKVWAFEPNWRSYRCAHMTVELNLLRNIELGHLGLGECCERLPIETTDGFGNQLGGSSRIVQRASSDPEKFVEVKPIDELIPSDRQIDVIQLDVEGFETRALAGALKTIQRCRPLIVLETLPSKDWIARNLCGLGYSVAEKVNANTVLRAN